MCKIIKVIIFDLDGVIINSNPEIEKFWHRWAAKTSRELTQKDIAAHIHGRKGVETLEALFKNVSAETKDAIIKDAIAVDSKMNPTPIAGIHHFILTLCDLKIPVGLVTSSHKQRALLMLEKQNLQNCFRQLVTAEEVIKGKPDSEPYLAIAKKLNIQPEHCLVFEDAISGVQSAKAAGMDVIGINNEEAAAILIRNGATSVVTNFDELTIEQNRLIVKNNFTYILQAF